MLLIRASSILAIMLGATLPALSQPNDYGGDDIVGPRDSEHAYAETRGWHVFAAKTEATFTYCVAETQRGDGSSVRLGWDGLQWQIAVPVDSSADWQGTLQIDGAGSGRGYQSGGDNISGTASAGWTIAWLGEAELDGVRKGSVAVLGVGKRDVDFSLSGAAAAITKVQECVTRAGAIEASDDPVPQESAGVRFGTSGSWVINEIRQGKGTVACEAYDPVANPNLRFEIDHDNAYVDFRDGGDLGALGKRIAVQVSFGADSAAADAEAEVIEGRDGNAWARITQGRNDGPGLLDDAIANFDQVSFTGPGIALETHLHGSKGALELFFRCSDRIN